MTDFPIRRVYALPDDEQELVSAGMVLGRIRAQHPSCPFTLDIEPIYFDDEGDEVELDERDDPEDFTVSEAEVKLVLRFKTEGDARFFTTKYEDHAQMLTDLQNEPNPLHLYFIEARWADAEGIENHDLWVRAESEDQAFDLWSDHYEIPDFHERSPYTRADAEAFYDVGFEIVRKKTYREPVKVEVGAIGWDEARRLMVEGL